MAKKIPQINASSMADISFLLLIFFLVTTSMDVNKGLARRLPPPPQTQPNQEKLDMKIKKRNLMVVKINSQNKLMVNGEVMEVKRLKDEVKKFILNKDNDPNLPEVVEESFDFGGNIGQLTVRYTKDHIISVQNDVDTKYETYLDVQNELVRAYNEVRDESAWRYYKVRKFNELSESQQKVIQKIYPQKISEAEPKNYN
jgi:biopolymer transport protein ExbD